MKRIISVIILLIGALSLGKPAPPGANIAVRCIPVVTINAEDTALHIINGVRVFNGSPFTGYINTYHDNGNLEERSPFVDGKLNGVSYTWFENGVMQSERLYMMGEKDGTHTGWYADGRKRFEYNFRFGQNEGVDTEWYPDGKTWKITTYEKGEEKKVQAWRTSGKLYANYEIKDGVIYGMNNSNLCYSLKDEKGNYETNKK